jgi:hypothetical protein
MNFSFDSVGNFLRQAKEAKVSKRAAIDEGLSPLLADPSTFAIAPDAADLLEKSLERYGDEALKAMAIVALGKWVELHGTWLEQHMLNGSIQEAVLTACDMTKLTQAIRLMEDVGSFGGDDDYRAAVREQINQAVLERLEETGEEPSDIFDPYNDPLL